MSTASIVIGEKSYHGTAALNLYVDFLGRLL
jgi:hypothetical protein